MDVGTGGATTLSALDAAVDFSDEGVVTKESAGPTYSIRANRSWKLMVKASSGTFSTPAQSKPSSDLALAIRSNAYTELNTADVELDCGRGTFSASGRTIKYRTTYYLSNDLPGEYQVGLTFTLTGQ